MRRGNLQREIKKKQPFDFPEQEAVLNVVRTGDQFQNRFGKLFREFGLTDPSTTSFVFFGAKGSRCRAWKSPTE